MPVSSSNWVTGRGKRCLVHQKSNLTEYSSCPFITLFYDFYQKWQFYWGTGPSNSFRINPYTWLRCNDQDTVLTIMSQSWDKGSEHVHIALYHIEVGLRTTQRVDCEDHHLRMSRGRQIKWIKRNSLSSR